MKLRRLLFMSIAVATLALSSCDMFSPKTSKKSKDDEESSSVVKGNYYTGKDVKETSINDYQTMKETAEGSTVSFYADQKMVWEITYTHLAGLSSAIEMLGEMIFTYEQKGSSITYLPVSSTMMGYTYEVPKEERTEYHGSIIDKTLTLETENTDGEKIHMIFEYGGKVSSNSSSSSDSNNFSNSDYYNNSSYYEDNTKPKIGLICLHDETFPYDRNFIGAFTDSASQYGFTPIIKTHVPESEQCYDVAEELANDGCLAIIGNSYGHEEFLIRSASRHPDIEYYHYSGMLAHINKLDNFHNFYSSIYEGRFIAGYVTGLRIKARLTETGASESSAVKVGYVASYRYAEVISQYTAWYLGIKEVIPNVTMDVYCTGSWYDPDAEENAAQELIKRGVVAISQHSESLGAPEVCDRNNILNSSYTVDYSNDYPNTYVSMCRNDWKPFFDEVAQAVIYGDNMELTASGDYLGTLINGVIQFDARDLEDESYASIIASDLKNQGRQVFDCSKFTVNGSHLTSYNADTDGDYQPDTNVIKTLNGITYFAESVYCSAPYFDITIDGIEMLNTGF